MYGFVHFASRPNAYNAIKKLNGVWFIDSQFRVNIARSHRRTSYWRKVQNPATVEKGDEDAATSCDRSPSHVPVVDSKSLVGVTTRRSYREVIVGDFQTTTKNLSNDCPHASVNHFSSSVSKSSLAIIENESLHLLDNYVIGVARVFYEAHTLIENFKISEVSSIYAKKISGRQFLIHFKDKQKTKVMKSQHWSWLKEWFNDIFPWTESFSLKYRVTWISCFGVPLHS
ncbi:hypothetical protein REPUB_Repub08aG0028400 [Reevesia pubescens]